MEMGGISKIPGIFGRQEKGFLPSHSRRSQSQPSEAEDRLSVIVRYTQMGSLLWMYCNFFLTSKGLFQCENSPRPDEYTFVCSSLSTVFLG